MPTNILNRALCFALIGIYTFTNSLPIFARSYLNHNEYGDTQFPTNFLTSNSPFSKPVQNSFFSIPSNAKKPNSSVVGTLSFSSFNEQETNFELIDDVQGYTFIQDKLKFDTFPEFEIDLVQSNHDIIPTIKHPIDASHPYWDIIFGAGKAWRSHENKNITHISLPVSLQQKNQNCIHNGVLAFTIDEKLNASKGVFQFGAETCNYLKFDLWGSLPLNFTEKNIENQSQIIDKHQQEVKNRLPTKNISEISNDFPMIDSNMVGSASEVHPSNMTVFGMVIDDTHYRGGCGTRFGKYPYCDSLHIPSYSMAKSATALAYLHAIKQYPELKTQTIASLVPQCRAKKWQDVTIEDALNMTTGNYISDGYEKDEYQAMEHFFAVKTHEEKAIEACEHFPRKSTPGDKWVYHTSDTYLVGVALSNYLKQKYGANADFYRDLLHPVWDELKLSAYADFTRRTQGDVKQPFAGYGMTYLADDIAKISSSLNPTLDNIKKLNLLDSDELQKALQMNNDDRGLPVNFKTNYKHAFWAWNAQEVLECDKPVWIPFMSGFGGITVAMLPNDIAYYYYSDNHNYLWAQAVLEANKIRPLCPI